MIANPLGGALIKEASCNYHTLNLGSALVELAHLGIPVKPFNGIGLGVAISSMYLNAGPGGVNRRIAGSQLRHGRLPGMIEAPVPQVTGPVHQQACSLIGCRHIREDIFDRTEVRYRSPELIAFLCVFD